MKLDIIIVTYNCSQYVGDCLDSLFSCSEGVDFRLFIVDNASQDGTLAVVKNKTLGRDNVKIIESGENKGFAKGNNLAIEQGHSPYLLLLNPDTVLKPGALAHMVSLLEEDRADIAGPCLLNEDGSIQRWAGGYFPSLGRALRHYFFFSNFFKSAPWSRGIYVGPKDCQLTQVDWICGACLFFKRKVVEEIGLLREDFFMYAEDLEFCYRAGKKGFRVIYDPTVNITHLYGKCSSETVSNVDFQSLSNLSVFFKETHGRFQGWVFDGITFLGFGLRAGAYTLLYRLGNNRFADKMRRCKKLSQVAWRILTTV